ncbi:hypothetical protein D3C86_1368960 [compost metagenome]
MYWVVAVEAGGQRCVDVDDGLAVRRGGGTPAALRAIDPCCGPQQFAQLLQRQRLLVELTGAHALPQRPHQRQTICAVRLWQGDYPPGRAGGGAWQQAPNGLVGDKFEFVHRMLTMFPRMPLHFGEASVGRM